MTNPTAELFYRLRKSRTVQCLVLKDGRQFEIDVILRPRDSATDDIEFPAHLYEDGGFILLGIEARADVDSLSLN